MERAEVREAEQKRHLADREIPGDQIRRGALAPEVV
jgi:hypothetical protein